MLGKRLRRWFTRFSVVSLAVAMMIVAGGAVAAGSGARAPSGEAGAVSSSSLGTHAPTFAGPAATGCRVDCHLLTGPFNTPSTAAAASGRQVGTGQVSGALLARAMPAPDLRHVHLSAAERRRLANATPSFPVPSVSCQPLGRGCDAISTSKGGATAVKGLNAVDSAKHSSLVPPPGLPKDIEPPDQGLCAGNGFVVEHNNIGEILVFNTALKRKSAPISDDAIMGLTKRHWSSGGDTSCVYDPANGGHWFFTEIVSASPESKGGAFTGCFAGVAHKCFEGIAVTDGKSPFGPYHVYFSNADYDPGEPGYPFLLNDFAKISLTRDAFLMFYDEFPLGSRPGFGGGFFNGAQEFAFRKSALEQGLPVKKNGKPNPAVTVARENMGLIRTPDGTCARDKVLHQGGVTCWAAAIPAQPIAGQYDNNHGGTGFMLSSLDFYGFFAGVPTSGDNRIAAWAWTGLSALNSNRCASCSATLRFRGQLFSGVARYFDPELTTNGFQASVGAQKNGPIPLGRHCSVIAGTTGPCPEGGINSNGDFMTQVAQAQGQLWGATATQIAQTYTRADAEIHQGGVYWVVGTRAFDRTGKFTFTTQGYVAAKHEDLEFPSIAAQGTAGGGKAIVDFTLNGNGGPTGADRGGFFPSSAYGKLTSTSNGLLNSKINIANLGKSPQDGFTEYMGFPGPTSPRWGDYSWALFLPNSGGRIYFANEYIQYPNCTGHAFNPHKIGTCGGTRDGMANWGTSVSYVVP